MTLINVNLMLVNSNGVLDQQVYVPLGLLSIAATIEQAGYNVELVDYQTFSLASAFDASAFIEQLGRPAPVVGLSCMANLLPFCVKLARLLKEAYAGTTIVLGGVGPSPVAVRLLEAFPFLDVVVEGEGELTMVQIMRGNVERLPPRRPPSDLDTLPLPAYHLIDFALYDAAPSIITSRGCPYRCGFCTEPFNFGERQVRLRSVDHVLAEIELVHRLSGRDLFLFQDDILPLKPARLRRLMEGLGQLHFPISWKCFSRVDLMSTELMREMAASGCVQVRYGVESGSNETLRRIEKGFTIEKAYEVACASLEHFPSVHASFIWGYPDEGLAEVEQTLAWVERFEQAGISVLLFEYSPLPGSPLFRAHTQDLAFCRNDYSFFVITGHEVVKPGWTAVPAEHEELFDMIEAHPLIFSGFYKHASARALAARVHQQRFRLTRRTAVKNRHDR